MEPRFLLEAGEKTAKEQLESLQRKAAGGEQARSVAETEPLLKRGRVTRQQVSLPANSSPPTDDDPIKRMNKWLASAEESMRAFATEVPGLGGIVGCRSSCASSRAGALTAFTPEVESRGHCRRNWTRAGSARGLLVRSLGRKPRSSGKQIAR